MPAAKQASRSLGMALAVSAMIGTAPARPGSARIARVAASPSISGICTSISTTSKPPVAAAATASVPLVTSSTSWPAPRR